MEDVLDLYAEREDPARPLVCFDEMPYQLIAETRLPLPAAPGRTVRYDYEYQRMGTCNLFVVFAPLAGFRHIDVTARRTATDFAEAMRRLVDVLYPEAAIVRVVLDNLNTHTGAAGAPWAGTRHSCPPRQGGSCGGWSSTTPRSTAVG